MPAYNFQSEFVSKIESGEKRQTIRPRRKRPTKPGDMLYLYTGQRTKKCRKIGEHVCLGVAPVMIGLGGIVYDARVAWAESPDATSFAIADGFTCFLEMQDWFCRRYGLPFEGEVIRW